MGDFVGLGHLIGIDRIACRCFAHFRRNKAGIPEKISLALASRWRGGNTVWGVGADIVRKTANRAAPAAYQVASTRRPDWFSN